MPIDSDLLVWLTRGHPGAVARLRLIPSWRISDDVHYVGVATGMNSLIRPALYGAWHDIFNLTRIDEPASVLYNVVGPICESGDFFGHERNLPPAQEGDVLLIGNGGAYGHAMSSHYTLREPAIELVIWPSRAGRLLPACVLFNPLSFVQSLQSGKTLLYRHSSGKL